MLGQAQRTLPPKVKISVAGTNGLNILISTMYPLCHPSVSPEFLKLVCVLGLNLQKDVVSCFCVLNQPCELVISPLVALSLNSPSLPLCNSVVWGLLVLVMGTAAMGILHGFGLVVLF